MDTVRHDYHEIPYIEDQVLDSPIDIKHIGLILAKHNACDYVAAWLAHRHNDLRPGCAMVHRNPDPDTDVCTVERLD